MNKVNATYRKLSEIVSIKAGQSFRKSVLEDPNSEHFVIQTKDILQNGSISKDLMRMSTASNSPKVNIQDGDVIVLCRGVRFNAATVRDLAGPTTAQNMFYIMTLQPDTGILPEFLACYINDTTVQSHLKSMAKGATVQSLKIPDLASIRIPIPPLEWQKTYVEFVKELINEQDLLNQLTTLRKEQQSAILQIL